MGPTVDKYVSKMIFVVIVISAIIMIGGAVLLQSSYILGFSLGVALAALLNIAKILSLAFTVRRATNMEPQLASSFTSAMYLLRFLLTGVVLVLAHFLPVVDLFGAALGLLSMPFATYSINFFIRRDERNRVPAGNTEEDEGHE